MKLLLAVLTGLLLFAGCSSSPTAEPATSKPAPSDKAKETPKAETPKPEGLVLQKGWKVKRSFGYAKVVGIVKNYGDAVDTYAQITFKAYDKKGNNIGDCLANTNSIDAKGSWKFEAACLKTGVTKVTFKEVTGG